jgi:hypothetical protein
MGRVTLGQGHTFGDLRIEWLAADVITSGRGLAELSGLAIDDYEG